MHPTICKLLGTDHGPLVSVMRAARDVPGVKRVLVASGVRMDLARRDPEYLRELAEHHVGGLLVGLRNAVPDQHAVVARVGRHQMPLAQEDPPR